MKTIQKLPKLPVFRSEREHKYFCEKSNKWLKYSTTQVCNELTEEAKQNIERLRHIWQPRGETVHYCLEQKMLGADDIDMGEYEHIVKPLFNHYLFKHFIPMGVEYMMSNPDKDVGGQLDLIGYDTETNQIRLVDLKTKGSITGKKNGFSKREREGSVLISDVNQYWKEPYSTDKQLGCYIEMLKLNCDIEPDVCNTIWAYPEVCIVGPNQPVQRCKDAWQEAWEKFEAKQVVF
jgi:hypothetical protein